MSNLKECCMWANFLKDESGATAIEYGVLAALIGVAIAAGARSLNAPLSGLFTKSATEVAKY